MSDWLGYARTGKEFEVMDALARLGINHWRGERIEFERRGRNRTADPYTYPALPNYVWIGPEPRQVHLLVTIPHLARTFLTLTEASGNAMRAFADMAERRKAEARRIIGNREAISGYQAGDVLEIRDGPFAGQLARFERMVQAAHDYYPTIAAHMEVMGRAVAVTLDPLNVRRAV